MKISTSIVRRSGAPALYNLLIAFNNIACFRVVSVVYVVLDIRWVIFNAVMAIVSV